MDIFKWRPHMGALAFAATSMASGFMNPVFRFYYVKIFLDRYKIPSNWFHTVQFIYMIWNAINDPLFGYCQDNCKSSYVRSRRHAMLYGAPFFALSFLIFWFPWRDYQENDWLCGVHLLVALCFYDSMYTYVLLAHGCIMAEMTNKHDERLTMLQYANCAHLLGSLSVFLCEVISNHLENYLNFQLTTGLLAVLAWACLTYTGKNAHTMYDLRQESLKDTSNHEENKYERSTDHGIFRLTWQILSNLNFTWFVVMNFMSEIHGSVAVNFCIIITDTIIPKTVMPALGWSIFYGLVLLLPTIIQTVYRPVLARFGYYDIHRYIFLAKICMGLGMFLIGRQFPVLFIIFVLCDSTLNGLGSSMQGLVMTDIIDDDMKIYNRSILTSIPTSMTGLVMTDIIDDDMKLYDRSHPMSSMVFGTNALVVKSPQSLGPMFTVALLNFYGYEQYKAHTLDDSETLQNCMFTLACVVPVVLGSIQYIAWSRFKIRKSHLTISKYVES